MKTLAAILVVLLAACGGDDARDAVPPAAVDTALAPPSLSTDLKLYENRDQETISAFANAGTETLVADGRIWEIRRADRLIGTLQIATVTSDIDLRDDETRDALVRQIIPGAQSSIRIGDTEVFTSVVNEKAVFLWFGAHLFEVLQVKDKQIEDFEALATAIIEHQETLSTWEPLTELIGTDDERDG